MLHLEAPHFQMTVMITIVSRYTKIPQSLKLDCKIMPSLPKPLVEE